MSNSDIPILHDTNPTVNEKEYMRVAIQAGVQSTEILNVMTITRITLYNLANLVSAMEKPEHLVYPITPFDVQKIYTVLKVIISQAHREHIGIIPRSMS